MPDNAPQEVQTALRQAIAGSFVAGFRRIIWTAALLAIPSAISAWVLIRD